MEQLALDAPLRDLNLGRALAEQGMARTLQAEREEWLSEAVARLREFGALPGWRRFKTEDFRAWAIARGMAAPHDHHVWGALTSRAQREGLIRFTGEMRPSVSPATRGHWVRVWEMV